MNYDEAVAASVDYLSAKDIQEIVEISKFVELKALVHTVEKTLDDYEERYGWFPVKIEIPDEPPVTVEDLIRRSESEPLAYDALGMLAADLLSECRTVPNELTQWLVSVLRKERERPPTPRGHRKPSPHQTYWRNFYIWSAVRNLVEAGMKPSRNAESAPESASDAVAEALRRLGMTPASYSSVFNIWSRYENRKRKAVAYKAAKMKRSE